MTIMKYVAITRRGLMWPWTIVRGELSLSKWPSSDPHPFTLGKVSLKNEPRLTLRLMNLYRWTRQSVVPTQRY